MLKKKLLAMLVSISICSSFATTSGVFANTDEQQDTNSIEFISKDFESGEVKTESVDLTDFTATETFGSAGEVVSQSIGDISSDGGVSPTSIIGDDDSYEILNTASQPYLSICHITAYYDINNDGQYDYILGGSGVLVSKSIVYTNAHNVYNLENNVYAAKVEVTAARNRYFVPFGTYEARKCFASGNYIDKYDPSTGAHYKYDWAAIILNSNLGERAGWLDLKYFDEDHDGVYDNYVGQNISVIGYPSGKNDGRLGMWRSDGTVITQTDKVIDYTCDTSPGSSGSPVINSNNQVIALHNMGCVSRNSGVLVSQEMVGSLAYFKYTFE